MQKIEHIIGDIFGKLENKKLKENSEGKEMSRLLQFNHIHFMFLEKKNRNISLIQLSYLSVAQIMVSE